MKNFNIYVDSGANIPASLVKERDVRVISFTVTINGKERLCYEEDADFEKTAKEFYEAMRAGAEIKTSLIGAQTFVEKIAPAMEEGKDAVVLTIASGISGTHHQAEEAKKILEKQYPKNKVYVIDSANASMGTGLLALKAADLRDMGESAESCANWLKENAYKLNSYLTVGDLKYIRKSGRISATLAIAGTILNIKPILRADGGSPAKIVFFGKERGRRKAIAALAKAFAENAVEPDRQQVAIMHADCEEEALELKAMVEEIGVQSVITGNYDLCTGAHVGPGTIALFFMGKDRRALPTAERAGALNGIPVPAK